MIYNNLQVLGNCWLASFEPQGQPRKNSVNYFCLSCQVLIDPAGFVAPFPCKRINRNDPAANFFTENYALLEHRKIFREEAAHVCAFGEESADA